MAQRTARSTGSAAQGRPVDAVSPQVLTASANRKVAARYQGEASWRVSGPRPARTEIWLIVVHGERLVPAGSAAACLPHLVFGLALAGTSPARPAAGAVARRPPERQLAIFAAGGSQPTRPAVASQPDVWALHSLARNPTHHPGRVPAPAGCRMRPLFNERLGTVQLRLATRPELFRRPHAP